MRQEKNHKNTRFPHQYPPKTATSPHYKRPAIPDSRNLDKRLVDLWVCRSALLNFCGCQHNRLQIASAWNFIVLPEKSIVMPSRFIVMPSRFIIMPSRFIVMREFLFTHIYCIILVLDSAFFRFLRRSSCPFSEKRVFLPSELCTRTYTIISLLRLTAAKRCPLWK